MKARLVTLWTAGCSHYREDSRISHGTYGPFRSLFAAKKAIRQVRDRKDGSASIVSNYVIDLGGEVVINLKKIGPPKDLSHLSDAEADLVLSNVTIGFVIRGANEAFRIGEDEQYRSVTIWSGAGEVDIEDKETLVVQIGPAYFELGAEEVVDQEQ